MTLPKGRMAVARYRYENLTWTEFENLVIDLCKELLGQGTIGFATGRDGGRDAKFIGTTNGYPSNSAPWKGTTIIQAKHTDAPYASFSDNDFLKNKSGVLNAELPKIKQLVSSGELDHYLLYANRRLTGGTDQDIRMRITNETGLPAEDIAIIGVEEMDRQLRQHESIAVSHCLDILGDPLAITHENLAKVIHSIHRTLDGRLGHGGQTPTPRTPLDRKNTLNDASPEFIERMRREYLKYASDFDSFLNDPSNQEIYTLYVDAVGELNDWLPALTTRRDSFERAWGNIYGNLIEKEEFLRHNRDLTKALLFYMYWICDFGKDDDDAQAS